MTTPLRAIVGLIVLFALAVRDALAQSDSSVGRPGADTVWAGHRAPQRVIIKNLRTAEVVDAVLRLATAYLLQSERGSFDTDTVELRLPQSLMNDSAVFSSALRSNLIGNATSLPLNSLARTDARTSNRTSNHFDISAEDLPEFNSLRTPTSPAFVMLGVEPSSIDRPTTPAAVALSIANATNQLTAIPKDFALEVSPYWLFGHSDLRWQDDIRRNLASSIERTFTFSLATAQIGTDAAPLTGLSLGFRTALISGVMNPAAQARLQAISAALGVEVEASLSASRELRRINDALLVRNMAAAQTEEARSRAIQEHARVLDEIVRNAETSEAVTASRARTDSLDVPDLAASRSGFFWDLSAGAAWEAPSNISDSIRTRGLGIWTTAGVSGPVWSLIGVGRYLSAVDDTLFNRMDFGARLIHAKGPFAVSVEGMGRVFQGDSAPSGQWRVVGAFNYEFKEGAWLEVAFGRGFDSPSAGNLVALLGLSFNVTRRKFSLD